jgi:hypothetical protein
MRKLWPVAWTLGLLLTAGVAAAAAQDPQAPASNPPATKQVSKKQDKKKKKKSDSSQNETSQDAKDRRAIHEVLQDFQDGFEGHSPNRVTAALDERFYDFPRFEDAVTQFVQQSSEIRLYLREATTEVKGDKAILIVDAEMAFSTKARATQDLKRQQRVQFDFARGSKGWKIIDINPRNFFTF